MPLDFPNNLFRRSSFGLEANTQTFTSRFTRNTQTLILSPGLWMADYTIRMLKRDSQSAQDWIAFFLKCDGRANSFYAYDPDRRVPLGPATGTPRVNGGGQLGNTLNIDGCTPNVVGWMRAGDYFSCNGQMHQLVQNANTNGSGQTQLVFRPPMREMPTDNATVKVTNVTCTMILTDDRQAIWECGLNGVYAEKTFAAMEVF